MYLKSFIFSLLLLSGSLFAQSASDGSFTLRVVDIQGNVTINGVAVSKNQPIEINTATEYTVSIDPVSGGYISCATCGADLIVKETITLTDSNGNTSELSQRLENKGSSISFFESPEPDDGGDPPVDPDPNDPGNGDVTELNVTYSFKAQASDSVEEEPDSEGMEGSGGTALTGRAITDSLSCCSLNLTASPGVFQIPSLTYPGDYTNYEDTQAAAHYKIPLGGKFDEGATRALSFGTLVFKTALTGSSFPTGWRTALTVTDGVASLNHVHDAQSDLDRSIYETDKYVFEIKLDNDTLLIRQFPEDALQDVIADTTLAIIPIYTYKIRRDVAGAEPFFEFQQYEANNTTSAKIDKYFEDVGLGQSLVRWELDNGKHIETQSKLVELISTSTTGSPLPRSKITKVSETYDVLDGRKYPTSYTWTEHEIFRYASNNFYYIKLNHEVTGVGASKQKTEYIYSPSNSGSSFDVAKTYAEADTENEYLIDVTAWQRNSDHTVRPWLNVDITSTTGLRLAKMSTGDLICFEPGTGSGSDSIYWPDSTIDGKFYSESSSTSNTSTKSVGKTSSSTSVIREVTRKSSILGMPTGYSKYSISEHYPLETFHLGKFLVPSNNLAEKPPIHDLLPGKLFQTIKPSGNTTEYSSESYFTPNPEDLANYPAAGGLYKKSIVFYDLERDFSVSGTTVTIGDNTAALEKISHCVQSIRGKYGPASETTQVWNGTAWVSMTTKYYSYSTEGKLLTVTRDGVVIESHTYPDDVTETITNAQGVTTVQVSDTNGRLISSTRLGAPLTSNWPAQPNVVSTSEETAYPLSSNADVEEIHSTETTSAGGLSLSSSRSQDIGGKTLFSTDETGVISYYSSGMSGMYIAETVSRASGTHTLVTSRYLDGQLQGQSGTGQIKKEYSYQVLSSGIEETETILDGSTVVTTNTRLRSGDGDLLSETVDGVTTTYTYDDSVRLITRSTVGQAAYRYKYDYRDLVVMEGYDVNNDGDLTADSTDIITEREREYELDSGAWWLVNKTSTYLESGNGSSKQTTTYREKQNISGGTVTQIIYPDGSVETSTQTVNGKTVTNTTVSTRYPGRTQTQVVYNGRLVSSQSFSQSQPVLYLYDPLGRQTTQIDTGSGMSQTIAYHPSTGLVTSQTNNAFEVTTYGYYPSTDANAGQVKSVQNSAGKFTYYAYNLLGQLTHQWGDASQPLRYVYDGAGRQQYLDTFQTQNVSFWSGSSLPTKFSSAVEGTDFSRRSFTMSDNRLTGRTYGPGSGAVSYLYNINGSLNKRIWAGSGAEASRSTSYLYNTAGQVTGLDYSDDTPDVAATYDRAGQLKTLTDAGGTHTFTYQLNGDVQEIVTGGLLDGLTLVKTLDSSGQVASIEWSFAGVSQKATYAYDSQKRLETAALGSVSGVPLVTADYSYHSGTQQVQTISRAITGGDPLVGTYTQDALGRLDTLVWQRGSTVHGSYDYGLNAAGLRETEARNDGTRLEYSYNDRGELTGTVRKRIADNTLRPDWSHAYTYDDSGDPKTTHTPEGEFLYHALAAAGDGEYDRSITPALNRWLRGLANPAATVTVNDQSVSREGEIWRYLLVNPASSEATRVNIVARRPGLTPEPFPSIKTITLPASHAVWRYDERGNLKSDAHWTYTWDMENRLISQEQKFPGITGDGPQTVKRLDFTYDAKGRRISKRLWVNQRQSNGSLVNTEWTFFKETLFLWQDWTLVAEFVRSSPSSSPALRRGYLWGLDVNGSLGGAGGVGGLLWVADYVPGLSNSNRQLAPWYDGNGNIMGWMENDSAQPLPLHRLEYDPYGRMLVDETVRVVRNKKQRDLGVAAEWLDRPPFAFSTKYEDAETGLLYYGYRYYSPDMGRWISRDPIGERGGINLYGMVKNDPVNRIDRLGLSPWGDARCICEITVTFGQSEPSFKIEGFEDTGDIYTGTMTVFYCDDKGKTTRDGAAIYGVRTGGFRHPNSRVKAGDDSVTPSGNFSVSTTESEVVPGLMGYKILENIPGRSGMYVHYGAGGTQGCIGMNTGYPEYKQDMDHTKKCCKKEQVKIHVRYHLSPGVRPPKGSLGGGLDDPGGNTPFDETIPQPEVMDYPPGFEPNFTPGNQGVPGAR